MTTKCSAKKHSNFTLVCLEPIDQQWRCLTQRQHMQHLNGRAFFTCAAEIVFDEHCLNSTLESSGCAYICTRMKLWDMADEARCS